LEQHIVSEFLTKQHVMAMFFCLEETYNASQWYTTQIESKGVPTNIPV
jgi:hypothetical protein